MMHIDLSGAPLLVGLVPNSPVQAEVMVSLLHRAYPNAIVREYTSFDALASQATHLNIVVLGSLYDKKLEEDRGWRLFPYFRLRVFVEGALDGIFGTGGARLALGARLTVLSGRLPERLEALSAALAA